MVKENKELKKRMSGVEEMVANLIVDQQAMAKAFQERGDRHSGSLERHRADLNTARKDILQLRENQSTIVDECSVLWTQVESMGDNLCRSGLRKKLLDSVMDMVIFRTIFFELLVFFTFTLLTFHFAY